ncbi:PBS lyase HEAT-like repeat protein [Staphylococcus petrasii]|uniref:PBS lyase HEAT-like repeat protein n=2 Tax=Staphylococcus petrasii TaxID=1276936 RepID=A0A380FZB7_9STAP|nr:PBS lyase HEAT-like repeat protein [Staphylococcus petrasii]
MRNNGSLLQVNDLGTHKVTKSEKILLQSIIGGNHIMQIVSIEETPNHNTMKINLDEKRADNKSNTFTSAKEGQPDFINRLFEIDGVKSIFYVMDFISVDKEENANWNDLLPQIQSAFN